MYFKEHEGSCKYSQQPVAGPCPQPDVSSPVLKNFCNLPQLFQAYARIVPEIVSFILNLCLVPEVKKEWLEIVQVMKEARAAITVRAELMAARIGSKTLI